MDEIIEWYRQLNKGIKCGMKFLCFVFVVVAVMMIVITFFYAPMRIDGNSMKPALSNGDIVIIDKISYRINEPERFDLIAFKYRYDYSQEYIKRIIGMPGETLYIKDNIIYILNSETDVYEVLNEYYGYYKGAERFKDCDPVTLKNDEYFVLGDNRYDSDDSRQSGVGTVKRDTIIGKACFRLFPFEGIGSLKYQ